MNASVLLFKTIMGKLSPLQAFLCKASWSFLMEVITIITVCWFCQRPRIEVLMKVLISPENVNCIVFLDWILYFYVFRKQGKM